VNGHREGYTGEADYRYAGDPQDIVLIDGVRLCCGGNSVWGVKKLPTQGELGPTDSRRVANLSNEC